MPPRDAVPLETAVVDFVRKSEEAALDVGRKCADAVAGFVPVELPLVKDLQKQVFDFVEELLRAQREFAHQAMEEARRAVVGTAESAAAQAPKKAVHKAA